MHGFVSVQIQLKHIGRTINEFPCYNCSEEFFLQTLWNGT